MIQLDNAVERYNKLILTELKEVGIKCWLAGGALRDYFSGVHVKTDYDMFFPSELEFEKAKIYFKIRECEIKWESENGLKIVYKGNTYDLVKKYFPSPQRTIEAFDFTVSQFAVDFETIYYGESSFIDLAKKQLMINKITYPASSLSRAFRYYQKGFGMCKGEMRKLYDAIQNDKPDVPPLSIEDAPDEKSSGDLFNFWVGID